MCKTCVTGKTLVALVETGIPTVRLEEDGLQCNELKVGAISYLQRHSNVEGEAKVRATTVKKTGLIFSLKKIKRILLYCVYLNSTEVPS